MNLNIKITKIGRAGRITLNRPTTTNALTKAMCEGIYLALLDWKDDDEVEFVIVDHFDGSRGFCAGSNVSMLAEIAHSDIRDAQAVIEIEFRLYDLISRYPKPCIAFMDGVTIGGGIGIAIHGMYQVATERSLLSMPETGIGVFPSAGSTWFLPRLKGEIGTWMALTGESIRGRDVAALGLASHYCVSRDLPDLKRKMVQQGISALDGFQNQGECSFARSIAEMDLMFSGRCVQEIKARLENGSVWARNQARKIVTKSPLSSKIALRQIRTGAFLETLRDALQIEYRIASRMLQSHDLFEGARAAVIEKDNLPHWNPPSLRAATLDLVSQYFAPLNTRELCFHDG
ncbi:MAG: enoyl-CoA hydratase/isomerase family protein [Pseudomonadota bacterium]